MSSACREPGPYGRKVATHSGGQAGRDVAVAELAEAQHGVISLRQLRKIGVSETAVHKQAARGRLHRIHRGVYAVGRRGLGIEGRFAAAVLACGPGAVLSHRAAAQLLGLLESATPGIDVTVLGSAGRGRGGVIAVHRSRTLAPEDVTTVKAIPAPPRRARWSTWPT